jgi:hypothetical protein
MLTLRLTLPLFILRKLIQLTVKRSSLHYFPIHSFAIDSYLYSMYILSVYLSLFLYLSIYLPIYLIVTPLLQYNFFYLVSIAYTHNTHTQILHIYICNICKGWLFGAVKHHLVQHTDMSQRRKASLVLREELTEAFKRSNKNSEGKETKTKASSSIIPMYIDTVS